MSRPSAPQRSHAPTACGSVARVVARQAGGLPYFRALCSRCRAAAGAAALQSLAAVVHFVSLLLQIIWGGVPQNGAPVVLQMHAATAVLQCSRSRGLFAQHQLMPLKYLGYSVVTL